MTENYHNKKPNMIEVKDITMDFPIPRKLTDYLQNPFNKRKSFRALHQLNININSGDRVGFLGVNGAGKTTFLKLIGGLLYPTTGSVFVNGHETIRDNLQARKAVGFVLNEERSFYWRLSGRQNLEFFGALDNLHGEMLKRRIDELLGLVGLNDAQHRLVATYSSGMKQRLAIARGLICDPQILILDEPTRTLDPSAVRDVKDLIVRKIHEMQSRTLLIATHRFDEAEELCNKICIMRNGQILDLVSLESIRQASGTVENHYNKVMKGAVNVA
jgi:ABC-2 type transport system ATP-binding protein